MVLIVGKIAVITRYAILFKKCKHSSLDITTEAASSVTLWDTVPFQPDKHGRKLFSRQIMNSHDHRPKMATQHQAVLRKGNVSPSIQEVWRVFGPGTNWKQHTKMTAKGVAVTVGRGGGGEEAQPLRAADFNGRKNEYFQLNGFLHSKTVTFF
jgi:hypothetical protein